MDHLSEYYNYSRLPYHIISKILSYLNLSDLQNAVQTCRAYYHASYDTKITRRICLKINPDLKNISYILRPFSQLKLYSINFNKFDYIDFFMKFGHHIKVIILTGCNISLIQLLEIFIFLTNLSEIKLYPKTETFDLDYFVISELASLNRSKIFTNLSKIGKLELQSHSCNLRGLEKILTHTINIHTLIFDCYWDVNFNIHSLFSIVQTWKPNTLKYLEINNMQNTNEKCCEFFKLFSILHLNNLIYLQLNNLSNSYHDQYFTSTSMNLSNLEVLKLQQCNENILVDVCRYMNSLRVLVLGGLVTSTLKEIGNLSKLEKLQLYKDVNSILRTDHDCVQKLFEISFKSLTSLDISFPVTNLNLITLCTQFQQLERLKLRKLQTKCCYPIFRDLINLKSLLIYFDDFDEPETLAENINITNLQCLEELEISEYILGIEPEYIDKLPKLGGSYFVQNSKIVIKR